MYRVFIKRRNRWIPVYIGILRHSFRARIFTTRKWHNYGCHMGLKDVHAVLYWSRKRGYGFKYIQVKRHDWD